MRGERGRSERERFVSHRKEDRRDKGSKRKGAMQRKERKETIKNGKEASRWAEANGQRRGQTKVGAAVTAADQREREERDRDPWRRRITGRTQEREREQGGRGDKRTASKFCAAVTGSERRMKITAHLPAAGWNQQMSRVRAKVLKDRETERLKGKQKQKMKGKKKIKTEVHYEHRATQQKRASTYKDWERKEEERSKREPSGEEKKSVQNQPSRPKQQWNRPLALALPLVLVQRTNAIREQRQRSSNLAVSICILKDYEQLWPWLRIKFSRTALRTSISLFQNRVTESKNCLLGEIRAFFFELFETLLCSSRTINKKENTKFYEWFLLLLLCLHFAALAFASLCLSCVSVPSSHVCCFVAISILPCTLVSFFSTSVSIFCWSPRCCIRFVSWRNSFELPLPHSHCLLKQILAEFAWSSSISPPLPPWIDPSSTLSAF